MDWTGLITGVVASVVATGIVATISVLAIFKPYMVHAKKILESSLRPVHEIPDAGVLACLLAETLLEFKGDYRRLILYRALPCELSLQFLRHSLDSRVADEEVRAINLYSECITRIVRQGQGAHDKTIFGRTGDQKLDAATRDTCLSDYFHADETMDTTELGMHDNFDEIGIILVGETIEQRRDNLKEWKAGFIVVFSQDFKTVRGFRHNVHGHIEHLKIVFDERRSDLEAKGRYFILSSVMPKESIEALRKSIVHFFSPSYIRDRIGGSGKRQKSVARGPQDPQVAPPADGLVRSADA
jgi:hypothetical protein